MKRFFIAWLLLAGWNCQACTGRTIFVEKVVDGFSHPESALLGGDGIIYVSNVGAELQPTAKDGDGFISAVEPDDTIRELRFLPAQGVLHAPKGLAMTGTTLYVADVDRIVGFDVTTRQTVFELTLPETSFLNDLTVRDDHTLLASASDIGKIAVIDLTRHTYTFLALPPLNGPNGLWYERSTGILYCVEFGADNKPNGTVLAIETETQQVRTLGTTEGYLDGVWMYEGRLYVSDWKAFEKKGIIGVVQPATGEMSALPLPEPAGGPADFCISPNGWLLLPAMLENRLYIHQLP